jgi:lauroyl/myristoyl acyltransferase
MKARAALLAAAYAAIDTAARWAGLFMREDSHPGMRACKALRNLRDAPSGPYFARAVLVARWRAALLLRYVLQLPRAQMRSFLMDRVTYEGAVFAQHAFNSSRPVILAAPHYGAAPVGFVAAVHRMAGHRVLNLFYDTQRTAPLLDRLFKHGGVDANTLLGGFPGVLSAMRALSRNEYLVMMPDAFDDITYTIAVPFFGRMLRVAPGTAYLALRSGAWIVPVFAAPTRQLGLHVTFGRPLDAHRFSSLDEAQAIFLINRALFASFEREIRRCPEHWHHWEVFPRVSTGVSPPGRLEDDAPLRLLRDKCELSPHLLEALPELELLVK